MRDWKELIKNGSTIVVTIEEMAELRRKYDKKYSVRVNRLQNGYLVNGNAMLQGIPLKRGEWL